MEVEKKICETLESQLVENRLNVLFHMKSVLEQI